MIKNFKRIFVIAMSCVMLASMLPGLFGKAACVEVPSKAFKVKPAISTVAVVKSNKANASNITYSDIKTMVWSAIDQAGGLNVKNGQVVVLKPNLVHNASYTSPAFMVKETANGVTTDWRVVKAVAEKVRALNPSGKIYVVEGSAKNTADCFRTLGYNKTNLPMVDEIVDLNSVSGARGDKNSDLLVKVKNANHLSTNTGKNGDNRGDYFYYNKKYYYDADVLISIPVLKNHWHALVTGGIKNLGIGGTPTSIYGEGSGNGRANTVNHDDNKNLKNWIHDYYLNRPADFVVSDGIQGSQYGPQPMNGLDPKHDGIQSDPSSDYYMNMRLILAGKDAVAVDTIQGLITNSNVEDATYLKSLDNSKAGNSDIRKIKVVGKQVDLVRKSFGIQPGSNFHPGRQLTSTDLSKPTIKVISVKEKNKKLYIKLKANSKISKVELLIDGKTFGSPITSKLTSINVFIPKVKKGKHQVTINAYNKYLARSYKTVSFTKKSK